MVVVSMSLLTACGEEENTPKTGTIELSTQNVTEKVSEKSTQRATEKTTQKSTQKATEKTTQKSTQKATEKTTQKSTQKTTQKPTQQEQFNNNTVQQTQNEPATSSYVPIQPQTETPQQIIIPDTPNIPQDNPPITEVPTEVPQTAAEFTENDVCVVYKNTTVMLDKSFSEIKASLGTPDAAQENPNCGLSDNGKGFVYTYGALTINTYMKNNTEYVETVQCMNGGDIATGKGIRQGSSVSDIKNQYGTPTTEDDYVIQYTAGGKNMMLYIENSNVIGIFLGR